MKEENDTGVGASFSRHDFADEITQPIVLARSQRRFGRGPGRVVERLAEAMEVERGRLEVLLTELLIYVDATPGTVTEEQVWRMRAGLLEIVDNVLPDATRERARSRLQIFLLQIAPIDCA